MTEMAPTWTLPVRTTLVVAIAMTSLAEAIYFVIWGVVLFPAGDLLGKLVWTVTCGIAMGAVIAGIVILTAPARKAHAFETGVVSMISVGVACAVLCSRIDARFDYFGGPEETTLFVFAGALPAMVGGLLFGWMITSGAVDPLRRFLGEA